jgi:putative DNA primase/helicase
MVITGIDEFVHRSDVVDRCVFLFLLMIADWKHRSEQAFWSEFQADYPLILGALLSAVSGGIRMMPQVQLSELQRMADFALWGVAVNRDLGAAPGTFLSL